MKSSLQTSNVIWDCVKKNNCFLSKKGIINFTKDPMSINGIQNKYFNSMSGKGIGIVSRQKKLHLIKYEQSKEKKPKNFFSEKRLSPKTEEGLIKILNNVEGDEFFYLPQLLHRVNKLSQTLSV